MGCLWGNMSALQKSDIKLLERTHGYNVGDLMVGVHPFRLFEHLFHRASYPYLWLF